MSLEHLVFDVTDADTIAASHSVGAYVRASDGTLITHTAVGLSVKALDVNVAGGTISCDLNGIYDAITNPSPDNVGAIFFSRAIAPGLVEQVQKVTAAGLGTILSADVSKVHALDVNAFGYGRNVTSGDFQSLAIDNTTGGLNVNISTSTVTVSDAALANTAIANDVNQLAVANTAQSAVASPLTNRKYLFLYNNKNKTAFIGTTGVTAANGFPVSPGSYIELRAGAAIDVKWVSADTTQELRSLQLA